MREPTSPPTGPDMAVSIGAHVARRCETAGGLHDLQISFETALFQVRLEPREPSQRGRSRVRLDGRRVRSGSSRRVGLTSLEMKKGISVRPSDSSSSDISCFVRCS